MIKEQGTLAESSRELEAEMVAIKCIAAAVGVTIAAFIPVVIVNAVLLGMGVSCTFLGLAWGVGMSTVARFVARDHLDSEHVWLWTTGGFLFGFLILPGLVFAYQWDRAKQEEEYPSAATRLVGRSDLEAPHHLASTH